MLFRSFLHPTITVTITITRLSQFRRFSQLNHEPKTLCSLGVEVLTSSDTDRKVSITNVAAQLWQLRAIQLGKQSGPEIPGRPPKPQCVTPQEIPSQKQSGVSHSVYLLHNLAHIELNAIDLVWDTIVNFPDANMPNEFYSDWLEIAKDECRHFQSLCKRLNALQASYGDLVSHGQLWKIANNTKLDLKERIVMIQLVQEARGLDSWERLVSKFYGAKDPESAALVDKLCSEEISHVQYGLKWFKYLCQRDGVEEMNYFQATVRKHTTFLPIPFNTKARSMAGLNPDFQFRVSSLLCLPINRFGC